MYWLDCSVDHFWECQDNHSQCLKKQIWHWRIIMWHYYILHVSHFLYNSHVWSLLVKIYNNSARGNLVPLGVKRWASGISCEHSATELQHPPTMAQWQIAGSLNQKPWVRLPVDPPLYQALCHFKGPQMVTDQIVSLITHSNGLRSIDESYPLDSSLLWSAQRLFTSALVSSNRPSHPSTLVMPSYFGRTS